MHPRLEVSIIMVQVEWRKLPSIGFRIQVYRSIINCQVQSQLPKEPFQPFLSFKNKSSKCNFHVMCLTNLTLKLTRLAVYHVKYHFKLNVLELTATLVLNSLATRKASQIFMQSFVELSSAFNRPCINGRHRVKHFCS